VTLLVEEGPKMVVLRGEALGSRKGIPLSPESQSTDRA